MMCKEHKILSIWPKVKVKSEERLPKMIACIYAKLGTFKVYNISTSFFIKHAISHLDFSLLFSDT